jgi:hypothetical protein
MKNALHRQIYKELLRLIEKKKNGEGLSQADRNLLQNLDDRIFKKLIK